MKSTVITIEVETTASLAALEKAFRSPGVANRVQDELSRELSEPGFVPIEIVQASGLVINQTKVVEGNARRVETGVGGFSDSRSGDNGQPPNEDHA